MRNISDHFDKVLKAPLNNIRWSWGAVGADGRVYLRSWSDEVYRHDGSWYVAVDWPDLHDLGAHERREHLAMVTAGTPCVAVICRAVDDKATPRVIADYKDNELWVLDSEPVMIKGANCLRVTGREEVLNELPTVARQ
jgi:hypothetical protein